jgi:hypothetical protein
LGENKIFFGIDHPPATGSLFKLIIMAKYICSICKKEIKGFKASFAGVYKCSKHGIVCDSCKSSGILGLGNPKCPKCGNELKSIGSFFGL